MLSLPLHTRETQTEPIVVLLALLIYQAYFTGSGDIQDMLALADFWPHNSM